MVGVTRSRMGVESVEELDGVEGPLLLTGGNMLGLGEFGSEDSCD